MYNNVKTLSQHADISTSEGRKLTEKFGLPYAGSVPYIQNSEVE